MFDLREYKERPNRLVDLLPWAALIRPGVVLNKNGSFQKTLRYRGPDLDSSTQQELMIFSARVNNVLRRMGSNWAIHVEARRRTSSKYPKSEFPDRASQLLDDERAAFFSDTSHNFESDYYITFTYLPPDEKTIKAEARMIKDTDSEGQGSTGYDKFLENFEQLVLRFQDMLEGFMPLVRPLDDDQTLTYLHSTISTKNHLVKTPEIPMYLDAVLPDMPLRGGLSPMLGDSYLNTLSIMSFPGQSWPGMMDALNSLSIEYRWVSRFIAMDKVDSIKELTSYKQKWFAKRKGIVTMIKEMMTGGESIMADSDAVNKAMDADQALQEVSDDLVSYGFYTSTITVWDTNQVKAGEKIKEVERIINGLGFVTQHEKTNSVQAWLGSLPGQCFSNVRRPIINTLNLCHMMPMSAVWAGPERNKHLKGPPLLHAVTSGNTPFRLVLHAGDVGHTMILGPTGSGKSVLLSTLALQFRRYKDNQVYFFDKGASARPATMAVGGEFYDIAKDESALAFQPLSQIDNDNERMWASEWLLALLEQEKIEINPQVKAEVWSALSSLATAPKEQRTLTGFSALLQRLDMREAITPYTLKGPYGKLLDADSDTLAYGRWQCFEMEELMNLPTVVPAVLSYLFHRLEARFTGAPTLLVLDEAWLFLDNPLFAAKIREWLKVLRKANVSVIFATQSVADAAKSSIASALIESCPTRIFLPNPRAMAEGSAEFYRSFGLNERQIQMLATATPKQHYYFQSMMGNRLFELGLGPIALALCASSGKDDQRLITHILQNEGKENFLVHFLRAKGNEDAADELEKTLAKGKPVQKEVKVEEVADA